MMHFSKLLCLSLLFLMACADAKTKEKAESKKVDAVTTESEKVRSYSIETPDGWTTQVMPAWGPEAVLLLSPLEENDKFRENINVLTESIAGMDRDAYITKSDEMVKNGLTDVAVVTKSDRTINGMDFAYRRYEHTYNGMRVEVDGYYVVNDNTAYVITCSARAGTIDKWASRFDKAVHSFRLN